MANQDVETTELVSRIRSAGGLTQEQLAQRLGVTFGTINGWENGKHRPLRAFRGLLEKLAAELGVPPFATRPVSARQVRSFK